MNAQQDKPMISTGGIQFYLDKAVFSGNEGKSYVEFYLMFFADQIKYKGNKGELLVNASVADKSGNPVFENKEWIIDITIQDKEALKTKVIYDQWNEYLAPGVYNLNISVIDANNKRTKGELKGSVAVPEISIDQMNSSEIEFVSSSIEKSEQFKKGNQFIVPNASRRYGILNPSLNFYYELYNLGVQGNLEITYSILDKDAKQEIKSEKAEIIKPGITAAILKEIDISEVKSGIYYIRVKVLDESRKNEISVYRQFEIIQGEFISNIKSLSDEEIKIYGTLLSYIGSSSQSDNFNKLNSIGKAEYLIQFWKNLDPTPGTPENEYLNDIQKRFVYAANNLGWSSTKGWETDMGRICIKYGMPDEVQQYNSESSTLPYQVWLYKESKEYQFVFGDLRGNGKFILLHSNKEGEISNSQWRTLLNKM